MRYTPIIVLFSLSLLTSDQFVAPLCALLIGTICIFSIFRSKTKFTPSVYFNASYLIVFCLIPFNTLITDPSERLENSVFYACIGIVFFWIASELSMKNSKTGIKSRHNHLQLRFGERKTLFISLAIIFFILAYFLTFSLQGDFFTVKELKANTKTGLEAYLSIIMSSTLIFVSLIACSKLEKREIKPTTYLVLLATLIIVSSLTGSRVQVASIIFSSIVFFSIKKNKYFSSKLVIGVTFFFVFAYIMLFIRSFDNYDNALEIIGLQDISSAYQRNIDRFNAIIVTEDIIENVDNGSLDYLLGKSIYAFPLRILPRSVLNEKPMDTGGYVTQKLYPWWGAGHGGASVEPSIIGEFYLNGGLAAVIIFMLALGWVLTYISNYFTKHRFSEPHVLLNSALAIQILGLCLGGINSAATVRILFLVLIFIIFIKNWRTQ